MAQITGTTWSNSVATYSMGTNVREDLEDVIWLLDPMDTYCLSTFDKVDCQSTFHEWLTDNLAAPAANRQIEGDDPAYSTAVPARRVGNVCQISRKEFIVSGTLEVVNKAGRASEIKRLGVKLMKELKRDMENAICTNQASSLGSSTVARSSAGVESWIAGPTASTAATASNVVAATTTAAAATTAGFSGGLVTSPTDGTTTGALTIARLNSALQGAWSAGGTPRVILCAPSQKEVIDTFTGIATRFIDSSPSRQAAIVNAANMYVSSYGEHRVVMSRYVRSSVVLCLDPDMWAVGFLRRPFVETLAQTGDAQKRQLLAEYTTVCRNPAASSKVVACA